jgi:hypothetical protein
MNGTLRICLVVFGLLLSGAVLGGVAAATALLVGALLTHAQVWDWGVFMLAALVGALFGGVLLPLTGFVLLRRVPLGLTLSGTLLGAVLGGAAGWAAGAYLDSSAGPTLGWSIGCAVGGFALSVVVLRRIAARRERLLAVPVQNAVSAG